MVESLLVLIELPIREVPLELTGSREPVVAVCGSEELEVPCVLIRPPVRRLLAELVLSSGPDAGALATDGAEDVLALEEPPMRDVRLESMRLPELAAGCSLVTDAEGVR